MDIEGERKSWRREEKETAGGIEPGRRYREERGKKGKWSLLIVGVRRRKGGRERERERRVAYNRGSEGATRK